MKRETFTIHAPSEQVEKWREESGDKKGNQSKYGRQMIEAGRKEMGLADTYGSKSDSEGGGDDTGTTSHDAQTVPDLKHRVMQQLTDEPQDSEEIVDKITEQLEEEVDEKLNELIQEGHARYKGGFQRK